MNKIKLIITLLLFTSFAKAQTSITSLPNNISQDDRIYGLAQIWSEAKYNFVYFDKLIINWDSLYRVTIPKVIAAKNDLEYYNELRHFAAQLHDGHTGVWYPMSYYDNLAQYAPLKTSLIEDKVFITALLNDTLGKQGLEKGMEIIRINDISVFDYANTYVSPFEGTSTLQGQNMMVYSTYLLNGPADELLKLSVKNKKGIISDHFISRKLKREKTIPLEFMVSGDGIGKLTVNTFDNSRFKTMFDSIYPAILKTKALVIDLRENGGGDGSLGLYLLQHLTKTAFPDPSSSYRQYIPIFKIWGLQSDTYFQIAPGKNVPFTERQIYEKPIAVLISKQTYSAAEDFTILFDYIKRGILVGQPSGGSTGQPLFVKLPGGGTFRVCIKKDTYPNGKEFVGIGIIPDILIPENADSFIKGEDIVLNKAVEYLKSKTK